MPSQPSPPPHRQSPEVYRRRRIAAALAALVVLALLGGLVGLVAGLFRHDGDPAPAAAPVSSEAPAGPDAAASPGAEPAECRPSDLRLVAGTDRPEYRRGEQAELRLEITNMSSAPCRRDVGTAAQEFVVTTPQGQDVFSTRVCQQDPAHQDMVLQPHAPQTAVYRWSGRLAQQDCGRVGDPAGPGQQLLTVSLGDLHSRPVAFRVREEYADGVAPVGPPAGPAVSGSTSGAPAPSAAAPSVPGASGASRAPATVTVTPSGRGGQDVRPGAPGTPAPATVTVTPEPSGAPRTGRPAPATVTVTATPTR